MSMMTMCVSDVLPPRPSYPASLSGASRLSGVSWPPLTESEADYPVFTDDEYQALMLAEFGPLMPLPTQDKVQAMTMPADDVEIQAPLLPEDELQATIANENEMEACAPIPPCPDSKKGRKKRKKPPPPSTEDAADEPSPRSSKRVKKKKLLSRRATNKMMATRLLKRCHSAPEPSETEGRSVLWCRCKELPRDSPGCALHQRAPFRSWMLDQDQIPPVGSDDGVVVPKTRTEHNRTVLKYIRWRSRVWMPSRFYVEHAQVEMALQEEHTLCAY